MHNSLDAAQPSGMNVNRRDFMKVCTTVAATLGLPASAAATMADTLEKKRRPSVIWLHFQECTGCTESLLRSTHPGLGHLILDLISLDYHETLSVGAGHQAEQMLKDTMKNEAGKYVCVVEGAIPMKDGGIYCQIGGKNAVDMLKEVADKAAAVIAIGSCASFGGIPSAEPNPTEATGAPMVLKGKTVVTIPGCPANPYNLLSTVLQFATFGTLPALDAKGRPMFAYARTIHEDCPRRAHFDAGRFAEQFGDDGHRNGYCLYKLGCKGPETHANCSYMHFCEVPGAWPIGVGHPCVGCTEQALAFRKPMHDLAEVIRITPSDQAAPLEAARGGATPLAAGLAGLAVGAAVGAGVVASKKAGAEAKEGEK